MIENTSNVINFMIVVVGSIFDIFEQKLNLLILSITPPFLYVNIFSRAFYLNSYKFNRCLINPYQLWGPTELNYKIDTFLTPHGLKFH